MTSDRQKEIFVKTFNVFIIIYAIARAVQAITWADLTISDITSWSISEFLINYEAGFIRRGLFGQLLYNICGYTGIDPRWIIVPLSLGCAVFVIWQFYKAIRKYDAWWWLIALPCCFGYIYMFIIRKDFINLTLIIWMMSILSSDKTHAALRLVGVTLISLIMICNNEASFFMVIPWLYLYMWWGGLFDNNKVLKAVYTVSTLVLMSVFAVYPGDANAAQLIHQSWYQLMPETIGDKMGLTVASLEWTTQYAMEYNDSILLVWRLGLVKAIIRIVCFVLMLIGGYYLLTRYFYVAYRGRKSAFPYPKDVFSALVLIQMASLLPMFLGLSCDFSRLFMYMFVIPVFVTYYMPQSHVTHAIPRFLVNWASKINSMLDKYLPENIYTLCIIILLSIVAPVAMTMVKGTIL